MHVSVVSAYTESQLDDVKNLFEEYRKSLDIDLCFQGYAQELESLPGKYAPPLGQLNVLYARQDSAQQTPTQKAAGCIALRPLAIPSENACEMKRLYVKPHFRGHGFARLLAMRILADAKKSGYSIMYLDTLSTMTAAIALYESLGFKKCTAYYKNPDSRAVYMKKEL